ncbi:MAG: AlpA family phage regulatory protein [Vicinamibacterales bacterium]
MRPESSLHHTSLDVLPEVGFVRLPQILRVLPIGKSTWWAGVRIGKFPAPIKLGARVSVWRVQDIRALLISVGASSDPD